MKCNVCSVKGKAESVGWQVFCVGFGVWSAQCNV